MDYEKEREKQAAAADVEADVNVADAVDEVMKKYDRESNTRIWEGKPKLVVKTIMALFSLYCIIVTLFVSGLLEVRLTMFLGLILVIGYLNYPVKKGYMKVNYIPWYDLVIMVLGAGSFFYFAANAKDILLKATKVTNEPFMVAIAIIGVLALAELCRRCVGILCVLGVLLVYTFYNQLSWNPSIYNALKNIIYKLFYTTSGVMGTPVKVCATYIVVFIIFGAFLERTGISNFFIDLANSVAGSSSGGPAKVAVISSALCGMVSGSSVGNTVTNPNGTLYMTANSASGSKYYELIASQQDYIAARSQNWLPSYSVIDMDSDSFSITTYQITAEGKVEAIDDTFTIQKTDGAATLTEGGETYYRLRDVAASVTGSANQFDVSWNGGVVIETKTAYTGNLPETSAAEGAAVTLDLTVDGQAVSTAAMLANGNYYVPASFLTTLGVAVGA